MEKTKQNETFIYKSNNCLLIQSDRWIANDPKFAEADLNSQLKFNLIFGHKRSFCISRIHTYIEKRKWFEFEHDGPV